MFSRLCIVAPLLALAACTTVPTASPVEPSAEPVRIRIVGINDFHGNLETPTRPFTVLGAAGQEIDLYAGGAAYVASAIEKHRSQDEYSLVISAGDLISASPLASSLFLDEPTIGVMNRIGLDYNAVGNHEFDRGRAELLRIAEGGCKQFTLREPCRLEPHTGAEFDFLAANVVTETGGTLFPAYGIESFGEGSRQVKIAVIGLTLEDTPSIVSPAGIEGLNFRPEAQTINALVPEVEAAGADAIVVAIHQGLATEPGDHWNGCGAMAGALKSILAELDPRVDLVISGHTHRAYVCDFGTIDPERPFTVTSVASAGAMLTDIAMRIDPAANEVIGIEARNVIVQNAGKDRDGSLVQPSAAYEYFEPDPEIAAYVARYVEAAAAESGRPVGKIDGPAPKGGIETQLGNLMADAQLAATREAGAQIALMNPGGIRADLIPAPDGTVSFGDIYAVQPFGNMLVTKTMTGAQLLEVLEQQFVNPAETKILAVSGDFAQIFDTSKPEGERVLSATLNGEPINPRAVYRVTMNSFLSTGGDGFTAFADGTDAVTGPVDVEAMEAYLRAVPVRELPETGRVTDVSQK